MKKLITLLMITAIFTIFAQTTEGEDTLKKQLGAEHTGWKTGGVVSVNFSQAAYSSGWAEGIDNSMAVNSLVNVFANFSDGINIWENTLELGYGFLKQGNADLVKSEDKIDLTSKYGRKAFGNWYYAGLFNFKSQITPTYHLNNSDSAVISEFLSPGIILGAAGMDWEVTPELNIFISPIAYRAVIMNDIDTDSNIGGYLRVIYKKEIFTNINYESKFEIFSNYQEDKITNQKPGNLDIYWNNLISMKVNEYLSANITFDMFHDDNLSTDTQFKEVLGIGLAYKF